MAITALQALLNPPPEPPPPPPKPGIMAFQRRLAEQRAAARNAPDPTPPRASEPVRTPRPAPPPAQGGERDARTPGAPERHGGQAQAALVATGFDGAWSGGGGGGGGGGQGAMAGSGAGMTGIACDAGLDCDLLIGLLPGDGDSGIFELLLPGGERLGVVADISRRQASFLLTPSSERLRQQINKARMELENGLAQRMDRHVRLTVL